MGRLGTRLIVTGQDLPWSPAQTPSCYDNYFASMGPTIGSQTVLRKGSSKLQPAWKPKQQYRIPSPSKTTPFCHRPQSQPDRYTIDPPLLAPSYNTWAAEDTAETTDPLTPPDEPAEEPCSPDVGAENPKDRCTWPVGLSRAANSAYIPREADELPAKLSTWRDAGPDPNDLVKELAGSPEALRMRPIGYSSKGFDANINMIAGDKYGRTESRAQVRKKQKGFAWLGPPRNLIDSNGGMWIKQETYMTAKPCSSIPKSCPLPLPYAPHKVPRKECKEHMERGTVIPVRERRGQLERSMSLSSFVGLNHDRNLNLFKIKQRQADIF